MDRSRLERLTLLLTGSAAFAMMGAGLSLYGPAALTFQTMFSLSVEQASRMLSAHWVGSLSAVLAMFLLPGRIGPRPGLFLLAAGAALLGSGISWGITILGAVVLGLGYGALTAVFNARILAAYGARGPGMLSLIYAALSAGAILAPLAYSLIASHPERLFLLLAGLTALVFLGAGPATGAQVTAPPARAGFTISPLILFLGAFGYGLEVALLGLGPLALVRSGVSETASAQLLSTFFLTYLAGRIALIFVADRVPAFALYLIGMTLASAGLWGCVLISAAWFFPVIGFAAAMFFPGYYITATALMGSDPRVSPFLIGVATLGAIVLPPVLAQSIEPFGTHGFFWAVAGLTLVLSVISALAYARLNRA